MNDKKKSSPDTEKRDDSDADLKIRLNWLEHSLHGLVQECGGTVPGQKITICGTTIGSACNGLRHTVQNVRRDYMKVVDEHAMERMALKMQVEQANAAAAAAKKEALWLNALIVLVEKEQCKPRDKRRTLGQLRKLLDRDGWGDM